MDTPNSYDLVRPGSKIRVDFALSDEEGVVAQTDKNAFDVVIGFGQLLPKIETLLLGARKGETKVLQLNAAEAFGERDPSKIVEFDRDEFPKDVTAGDHFEAEQEAGAILVLRVVEVLDDAVVVDLNHPLAGQNVSLSLTVVELRPATQSELEIAKSQKNRTPTGGLDILLAPESLLRGRKQR